MPPPRRHINAQLRPLKRQLATGVTEGTIHCLCEAKDPAMLVAFREQKLFARIGDTAARRRVADAFVEAANRIFASSSERSRLENYAEFMLIIAGFYDMVPGITTGYVEAIPRISQEELLELMGECVQEHESILAEATASTVLPGTDVASLPAHVAAAERLLHEQHGRSLDLSWAAARALNEAIKHVDTAKCYRSGQSVRTAAKSALAKLIWVASLWNGIDYATDKVAYGEWCVSEVRRKNTPHIYFDIVDVRLEYARLVGTRRRIVSHHLGKKMRREMRVRLQDLLPRMLQVAVDHYANDLPVCFSSTDYQRWESGVCRSLDTLDIEDDMLLLASGEDPLTSVRYLAAASLQWFAEAAQFVRRHLPKRHRRQLIFAEIPVELVADTAGLYDDARCQLLDAMGRRALTLPVRYYRDICQSPFVLTPFGAIRSLGIFHEMSWPTAIRSELMQGGERGKEYGAIWEEYVAGTLREHGWAVVGRGVKVREAGQALTDIDILAVWQGLLLVLQAKALINSGAVPYDHWRERQAIINGSKQAAAAADFIRRNPSFLVGVSPDPARLTVTRVQPVVLTNMHTFNGWAHESVPVISIGGLMSILNGARVEYSASGGAAVMTRNLTAARELTPDEFLGFLQRPVDWHAAEETGNVEYRTEEVGGLLKFTVPSVM